MDAPYKIGAILRKFDGGFYKLLEYKKCEANCPDRIGCGGYALTVQKVFGKNVRDFCPIRNHSKMFNEVKLKRLVGRSIMVGEEWIGKEI